MRVRMEGEKPQARHRVLLVTGFLGSGKTTLLNHLLRTPPFEHSAVVISEYGAVGVDHALICAPRQRMRVIDSGCLCGHVHEEVASSLLELDEERGKRPDRHFDRVLIETSGLADPVPIVQVLTTDPLVTAHYELGSVITVADGVHGLDHLGTHEESVKQAAVADTILLNKMDVTDAAEAEALADRLACINPCARHLRVAQGAIDPAILLETAGLAAAERSRQAQHWLGNPGCAARGPLAAGNGAVRTFVLEYEGETTVPGLVLWINLLAGFRGSGLLRVKGIVNVEGRPYAIQAVQTIVSEPVPLDAWPEDGDTRSRLVFITRGIDTDDIRRTFAAFRFEAGRAPRNAVINPRTYARFRDTIELFRTSPGRTSPHNEHESTTQ
jgi:G3E family GTPase